MKFIILLLAFCFSWTVLGKGLPANPISIEVKATHLSGKVLYEYQVINKGDSPVKSFVIGCDFHNGESELKLAPVGWTVEHGVPSASVHLPKGWSVDVIPTEDTDLLQIEWKAQSPSLGIQPGQSLQGFGIFVPKDDPTYLSSHWTAFPEKASSSFYSGLLIHKKK